MLNGNLLISQGATTAIVVVVLCVLAIASFVYGVIRKFSRMGWTPWQLPILFGVALLTQYVPETELPWVRYLIVVGIFLAGTALVFGLGALIRHFMHAKMRPAALIWQVLDRILGAVTAFLGYAVILLALGGLALPFLANVLPDVMTGIGVDLSALDAILPYALDFFVITLFACAVQAGYRVGFGRAVIYAVTFALIGVSFILSLYLAAFVGPFRALSKAIYHSFGGALNPIVGKLLGGGICAVLLFIIFTLVSCIIGFFLNKLLRHIKYVRVLNLIDGILLALVFFAVVCAITAAIHTGVWFFASGAFRTAIDLSAVSDVLPLDEIQMWAERVEAFVTSSPFSRMLYLSNPVLSFLPA